MLQKCFWKMCDISYYYPSNTTSAYIDKCCCCYLSCCCFHQNQMLSTAVLSSHTWKGVKFLRQRKYPIKVKVSWENLLEPIWWNFLTCIQYFNRTNATELFFYWEYQRLYNGFNNCMIIYLVPKLHQTKPKVITKKLAQSFIGFDCLHL